MTRTHAVTYPSDWENVFVLTTGRSGSVTLSRALAHATNASVGHETNIACIGAARLQYPSRHIEVDNRLAWFLGGLERAYGDAAIYVHLKRSDAEVAASYARRWYEARKSRHPSIRAWLSDKRAWVLGRRFEPRGLAAAFATSILWAPTPSTLDEMTRLASHLVQTVNDNIEAFLRNKPYAMSMTLEDGPSDLGRLWEALGLEGHLDRARLEFRVSHNRGSWPGR